MNKRLFIWIVTLMAISLPGIVALQFIWHNNPVAMNNELFGKIVHEALKKTVQEFEFNQDIRTIDENLYDDTWDGTSYPPSKSHTTVLSSKSASLQGREGLIKKEAIKGQISEPKIITERDSVGITPKTQTQSAEGTMGIGYQYWNTRRPIDIKRLKAILDGVLRQTGISIPYKYAIFEGDSIQESDIRKSFTQVWYKEKLFSDDIFSRDLYIGICFPGTHAYLSHNKLLQVLSFAFTMVIMITYLLGILFIIRQKRLSNLKTDFINHMTHEFKTPIATISIAADSILNDEVIKNEERVDFYTRMIKSENQRMNEHVDRILQIAKLDRKELFFNFQEVDVHKLIENAIRGIWIQIDQRGGRIDTKLEAKNPVITTDPTHFTNLIHNLLDNANKYSPDAPEILIRTDNDHKGLYMTVEDKGIGISKRVQSKIFNKFYRLTSESLDNIKGFGLGLSYIKSILAINKGKIKVHSEQGKGSQFVVFIPYSIK